MRSRSSGCASLEAGLKYLIVGSFGSAILLFGSAFVYGATGDIGFEDIAAASGDADRLFLVAGLAMIIVGLGFKASAAPFHMWTPDVYQGAPTPVTAFMSAATKVAALVLTMRLLVTAFPSEETSGRSRSRSSSASRLPGGTSARSSRRDVKRMLAYSSISHAGFLLMPIAVGTPLGGRALIYYLIPYAAMSIGSFAVVAARERELAQPVTLEGMSGIGWERPGLRGGDGALHVRLHRPAAGRALPREVLRLLGRGRPGLGVARRRRGDRDRRLHLLLPRRRPGDVLPTRDQRVAPAGGSPPRELALGTSVLLAVVVDDRELRRRRPLLDIATDAVSFLPFPH